MESILTSLFPLLLAIGAGYSIGFYLPASVIQLANQLINPLVWLMLFYSGHDFGHVLNDAHVIRMGLNHALIFSVLTNALSSLLVFWLLKSGNTRDAQGADTQHSWGALGKAAKECMLALSLIAAGILAAGLDLPPFVDAIFQLNVNQLLYAMIFVVGIDLTRIRLGNLFGSVRILYLPALVVAGSLLGGIIAALWTGDSIRTGLALASGFGWFTLSSVLVSSQLGEAYGAIALLTDLFRELMAVIMLYMLGNRFAQETIAACGATALDASLPLIKQKCGLESVSAALVSGLILTIAGPVMIILFLHV